MKGQLFSFVYRVVNRGYTFDMLLDLYNGLMLGSGIVSN